MLGGRRRQLDRANGTSNYCGGYTRRTEAGDIGTAGSNEKLPGIVPSGYDFRQGRYMTNPAARGGSPLLSRDASSTDTTRGNALYGLQQVSVLNSLLAVPAGLACVFAAGCATGYGSARRNEGYMSFRTAEGRYLVAFVGNKDCTREYVGRAGFLRCAELSKEHGPGRFDIQFDGDEYVLNAQLEKYAMEPIPTENRRAYAAMIRVHSDGKLDAEEVIGEHESFVRGYSVGTETKVGVAVLLVGLVIYALTM